ncbi:lysophospholipid acyltransferase family protein [Pseudoruegeria sp. HB172150]|uniref:lysophospholipid acyltransferase family protein n=1 Tax=Pseudoruegeria sp. HB172150 TaxID=2721164 RepID=UPI00155784AC
MIARSLCFHLASALATLVFLPAYVLVLVPVRIGWPVLAAYIRLQLWLLRMICGQRVEVTGVENLPAGPCLLAARHESMWETMFLPLHFHNPAVLLKQEILRYPLAGPIARRLGHIGIDRSGDLEAARASFTGAKQAASDGRSILIFPSGTRDPALRDRLQSGVAVLYRQLGLPCVPVTHNSGRFWPHRSWLRHAGTIRVEIRPPIPAGLKTKEFIDRLAAGLSRDG